MAIDVPRNTSFPGADEIICYTPVISSIDGIWQGVSPLSLSFPLFTFQVLIVIITTRSLALLMRPFRQPRALAEILGGIVLGPSVLGQVESYRRNVFPVWSLFTLETIANIGLLLFLFLVGVEMDVDAMRWSRQKAVVIAAASVVIPFAVSATSFFSLRDYIVEGNVRGVAFVMLLGVVLSVTAFPILARILAELKLLNSDVGRISMTAAVISDMCSWILLAISISLSAPGANLLPSLWIFLSALGFTLFCYFCGRPAMYWFLQRLPEGQPVSNFHICLVLTLMMLASVTADAIGAYTIFGAFMFGLVIPNNPLGVVLIEKLEDVVTGLFLPLYFVVSGLRTDLTKFPDPRRAAFLFVAIALSGVGKVVGIFAISVFYSMPVRDGISIGILMNTRGLVEIIILNIGREAEVIGEESFAVLVVSSLVMTAIAMPVVSILHRPPRRFIGHKQQRNSQRAKPDTELRVLACVHNTRNVPSIISFLTISNAGRNSRAFVYALHLLELTDNASAMLIVHNPENARRAPRHSSKGRSQLTGAQSQSTNIFRAFENYDNKAGGVSVQTLTILSPYATMHEDICSLAEDKHVTLVVIPFHKQQTVDGGMEPIHPSIKMLNERVIEASQCSVGILLDRGLSRKSRASQNNNNNAHQVALFFFGGPDDREALAYGWRMAENPEVDLTVIRFFPTLGEDTWAQPEQPTPDASVINIVTEEDAREKNIDDEHIEEFRARNARNQSVVYSERLVRNTEETVAAIRTMGSPPSLYVVGRSQRHAAAATAELTAGLTESAENPELGPLGDLLATSDFAMSVSVLVVHQFVEESLSRSRSSGEAANEEQPVQHRGARNMIERLSRRAARAAAAGQETRAALNVERGGG